MKKSFIERRKNKIFGKHVRNENGFTMIEMMVVLIIIAVLIGGGIKFYLGYIENSRVTKAKAQISILQASLDCYYSENFAYPTGASAAALDTALSNIGIKGVAETAVKSKLDAKDPWGSAYIYEYNAVNKACEIYTGYDKVQNPASGTTQYVVGRGLNGSATTLQLELSATATPPDP